MGCGGSEEKKGESGVSVDESGDHVSLHLRFGLREGKTIEQWTELYYKEVECLSKVEGCLHFQAQITEDAIGAKTALLTEKYSSAEAHLAANVALAEAGLVEGPDGIFATYDFVELKFGLSKENMTPDYQKLLDGFEEATGHKPITVIHDFLPCKCMKPGGTGGKDTNHIVLTATVGLAEGKTLAQLKELYVKEVEVAKATPGCLHFALEINEETAGTATGVLHEMYVDDKGHLELNKNLDAAGLVTGPDGIFATYAFKEMKFGLRESSYTDPYKELMGQFAEVGGKPTVMDICDLGGKVNMQG